MIFERIVIPLDVWFVKFSSPSMLPVMFVISEPSVIRVMFT